MKILLTGSSGQLARELQKLFKSKNIDFSAPDEKILDITDSKKVKTAVSAYNPTHIINCAAYNLVDDAEENLEKAFLINRDGVEILAEESNRINAFFTHFSTDYVFDGAKNDFYTEADKPNPLNKYAQSKYEGEEKAKLAKKNLILRLSWVIGEGNQNFLYKLNQWSKNNRTLKISSDEVSVPTFTFDIADVFLKALENDLRGTYHLTNSGYASRYELAKLYFKLKKLNNIIIPVPMDSFQSKAVRPHFTAMSNALISSKLKIEIPSWEESLEKYIKEYGN
ncbi:MAG: dTDP-4-dehydrorhamnose reductase [Endomicrobia bacterium]|nr:dTDP-4-dehydrorhamnose reductase [Endomicrobiia bacterium]